MVFNDWKSNAKFQGNNLYITYPKNDSSWTNPKDLGFRVNTDKNDIYPYISPDGKYLLYTIRDGAFGALSSRIYWISTAIFDSIKNTNTPPYQKLNIIADTVNCGEYFSFKINEGTFVDDDEGDSLTYTAELSDDEEITGMDNIQSAINDI